jgi:hypothetical protein
MATMFLSAVEAIASSRWPRRRAGERRAAALREIRAAGDHRVGGADAGDLDHLEAQPVLVPKAELVGDERGGQVEGDVRHRHGDVFGSALRARWRLGEHASGGGRD